MKSTIKKSVLAFGFFVLGISLFAGPSIAFDSTAHEFGTIKEANGPVSTVFTFVNNGDAPLVVNAVRPSCGCTSPEWSKEPILPGKEGYIKATYNPKNRPGKFEKSISVSSNSSDSPTVILIIKGDVIPAGMIQPQ